MNLCDLFANILHEYFIVTVTINLMTVPSVCEEIIKVMKSNSNKPQQNTTNHNKTQQTTTRHNEVCKPYA